MAETEITQKQWTAMDLNNPSQYQGNNIPVTFISFYDAALWCNKLSKLEGLDTCYNLGECKNVPATGCDTEKELEQFGCGENTFTCGGAIRKYSNMYLCPGYRLPTTVEWEYAAKADFAEARTYGGNLLEENLAECFEQPSLNDIAWYCYNSEDHPHPVAQKKPNPWGLYDTLGNTFEWIDYFDHGRELNWYEEKEPLIDPTGTPTGIVRDLRGGSYYSVGCLNNPTFQNSDDSYARGCDYGFRPVRTLFE
jgi:formylglycine-generating enzyme required for sulfatase activity